MTNDDTAAESCPSWCRSVHKPSEVYPSHSATVADFGPYGVMIGRVDGCTSEHVHLMDTRAFLTTRAPERDSSRESAMLKISDAAAIAGILHRATDVLPRAGTVAAAAAPYVAALNELRAVADALAEGVRILDASRPDNPPPPR